MTSTGSCLSCTTPLLQGWIVRMQAARGMILLCPTNMNPGAQLLLSSMSLFQRGLLVHSCNIWVGMFRVVVCHVVQGFRSSTVGFWYNRMFLVCTWDFGNACSALRRIAVQRHDRLVVAPYAAKIISVSLGCLNITGRKRVPSTPYIQVQ
jgi:hypothetical protein